MERATYSICKPMKAIRNASGPKGFNIWSAASKHDEMSVKKSGRPPASFSSTGYHFFRSIDAMCVRRCLIAHSIIEEVLNAHVHDARLVHHWLFNRLRQGTGPRGARTGLALRGDGA
jgi:hypothetical protein